MLSLSDNNQADIVIAFNSTSSYLLFHNSFMTVTDSKVYPELDITITY